MSYKVSLYDPQIYIARNNVVKQATKTGEAIPLTGYYKIGTNITLSSDGKYIVIGDNVKVVKITSQLHFAVNDTKCGFAIRKNSNGTVDMIGCSYGDGTTYCVNAMAVCDVKKGDKIYIATMTDTIINPSNGGGLRSYLMVEKIS